MSKGETTNEWQNWVGRCHCATNQIARFSVPPDRVIILKLSCFQQQCVKVILQIKLVRASAVCLAFLMVLLIFTRCSMVMLKYLWVRRGKNSGHCRDTRKRHYEGEKPGVHNRSRRRWTTPSSLLPLFL